MIEIERDKEVGDNLGELGPIGAPNGLKDSFESIHENRNERFDAVDHEIHKEIYLRGIVHLVGKFSFDFRLHHTLEPWNHVGAILRRVHKIANSELIIGFYRSYTLALETVSVLLQTDLELVAQSQEGVACGQGRAALNRVLDEHKHLHRGVVDVGLAGHS